MSAANGTNDTARCAHPRGYNAAGSCLAQLAQTVIATRTQAAATIEQCDSALMVVHALQQRERDRQESLRSFIAPAPKPTMPPMFGRKQEG
jgi:hypothetical protein